jgi:site-specific recombinase XerD
MKLSALTKQYIELKQSMGSRFRSESVILKAFSKAMGDIDITKAEPEEVLNYISGTGPVTLFWHRKHETLRGFYHFAIGRGYATYSPLPRTLPRPSRFFTPYIYSSEELHRLLEAAKQFGTSRTKLQSPTIHILILLLYGAGLRISEALSLKPQDINLSDSLLTIRESKFYKTRLVPIGIQLTNALAAYMEERSRNGYPNHKISTFFITRSGEPVKRSAAERAFCCIRKVANVFRNDGARYQPRLHDLRHAFAVHRLVTWYRQGADVQRLLPLLSTYLGHIHIAATQRYLTMTPELLQEASARFENYARPKEVTHDR